MGCGVSIPGILEHKGNVVAKVVKKGSDGAVLEKIKGNGRYDI